MSKNFYQFDVTTIATCFWLKLNNGQILGFTDHHENLHIKNQLYYKTNNFENSAISKSMGLETDNLTISGFLDHELITIADINKGLYEQAAVKIFQIDYNNPNGEQFLLHSGFIGQIELKGPHFVAEINSVEIRMEQNIISLYSPNCRARLGDNYCGINLKAFTYSSQIVSVINPQKITILSAKVADGYFNYGILKLSNGLMIGINKHYQGTITLASPITFPIKSGDAIELIAGCDKTFENCCSKFNNVINFRGEPHLPGLEQIFKTPGNI